MQESTDHFTYCSGRVGRDCRKERFWGKNRHFKIQRKGNGGISSPAQDKCYGLPAGAYETWNCFGNESRWHRGAVQSHGKCFQKAMVSFHCFLGDSAHDSRDDEFRETQLLEEDIPFIQDELDNVTTIIYLLIEGIRDDPVTLESGRTEIRQLFHSSQSHFKSNHRSETCS